MRAAIPFGVGFSPSMPAPRLDDAARLAERLGFTTFWITDSHLAARLQHASAGAYLSEAEYHDLVPEHWIDRFAETVMRRMSASTS